MAKNTDKPKKIKETILEAENVYKAPPNYKDEIVKKLKAKKLIARNDKGIIYAYYKTEKEFYSLKKRLDQVMIEVDYHGSYGIKHLNNGEKEIISSPREMAEELD